MPRWRAARWRSRRRSRRPASSAGLDPAMHRHNNPRWTIDTQRGNTMRQEFIAALLTAFVAPAVADDVAPGGTIRAVYIGTNPAQATRDAATGTTRGPSYDLTVELGKRLGIAVDVKPVAGPAAVIAAVSGGEADIGFIAFEPSRAGTIEFSQTYLLVQ